MTMTVSSNCWCAVSLFILLQYWQPVWNEHLPCGVLWLSIFIPLVL